MVVHDHMDAPPLYWPTKLKLTSKAQSFAEGRLWLAPLDHRDESDPLGFPRTLGMGRMGELEAHSFLPGRFCSKLQMQLSLHFLRKVTGEGWGCILRKLPASTGAELLGVEFDVWTSNKSSWACLTERWWGSSHPDTAWYVWLETCSKGR